MLRPALGAVLASLALTLSGPALLPACQSSTSALRPAALPEGTALLLYSPFEARTLAGRSWSWNDRAHQLELIGWLRERKANTPGETLVLWTPRSTPMSEVLAFMDILDAAGVDDYAIKK